MGPSLPEYLFIRACIVFLHFLTPLCVTSCVVIFVFRPYQLSLPIVLKAWLVMETLFYLVVYLPLKRHLQKPASHPELATRDQRSLLFSRCMANVPDPEKYLSIWFMDSPPSEIKRENVKHFLRWAFLMTEEVNEAYEDEVEEYTILTEELVGRKFEPGYGKANCIRLTFDKVDMLHRSLLWYWCVFVVDSITSGFLIYNDFTYYRTPLHKFFSVFPFRPHNLFSRNVSPSSSITYWHRPHTSKTRLPILFIHGIGIGLYPYVDFLAEINHSSLEQADDDGTVGIIAIEIMPISFRITAQAAEKHVSCAEINKILEHHGWNKFVLVSHSYGSVITTHLLHTPAIASKIGPVLLIDPVTFLLHLPDVAYNFLCRKPKDANEHRLEYFASRDSGVAHTISRTFFWSQNIIWKEDLADRTITVVLSGKDMIVNALQVGRYLSDANAQTGEKKNDNWKFREWVGKGLDLIWFEELNHAEVFDEKSTRVALLRVLRRYCVKQDTVCEKPGNDKVESNEALIEADS